MWLFIDADFDENALTTKKFESLDAFLAEHAQGFAAETYAILVEAMKSERGKEILEEDGDLWLATLIEVGEYEAEWHSYELMEV